MFPPPSAVTNIPFSQRQRKEEEFISHFWLLPELLSLIRDSLSQSDFAALCLACRSIHHGANPILYEELSVDFYQKKVSIKLNNLRSKLQTDPTYSSLVRGINIQCREPSVLDQTIRTQKYDKSLFTCLLSIIKSCRNLRKIRVNDCAPSGSPSAWFANEALRCNTSLSQLTSTISVPSYLPRYRTSQGLNEQMLLHAIQHPSLRSVRIAILEGQYSPLHTSAFTTCSTITHLVLHHADIRINTLHKIIKSVPHVRDLDVCIVREPLRQYINPRIDLAELGAALLSASGTLESLKLAFKFNYVTISGIGRWWGPFGDFPSLLPCRKLHTLELPPETIVDYGIAWTVPRLFDLSSMLPENLQVLKFRGNTTRSFRQFQCLSKVIKDSLRSASPMSLKHLSVTCDVFEPESCQRTVKRLTKVCDEVGLPFTLRERDDLEQMSV